MGWNRPVQKLLCLMTASEPAACHHPDDDLALKLFWGRQRGLAVIFAADAEQWAQRCVCLPSMQSYCPDCLAWDAKAMADDLLHHTLLMTELACYAPCRLSSAKVFWALRSNALSSEKELKHTVELAKTACRMPERCFLGDDCQLEAIVLDDPAQQALEDAAHIRSPMPAQQADGDIESLQPQQNDMGSKDGGDFRMKLAIPHDACSVEGPPTPDNEEGDRASMPASRRLTEVASPGIVAAAARALHLQ